MPRTTLLVKSSLVHGYYRSGGVVVSPYLRSVAQFAAVAHKGQTRKDVRKTPYISHPYRVANILRTVGHVHDEEVLAAAILHDTIEDTHVSHADLVKEFGQSVADMVAECSDDKDLHKDERKRLQVEHATHKSAGAALVKVGDMIANLADLMHSPPAGWPESRIREYFDWAHRVVSRLPLKNQALKGEFQKLYRIGMTVLVDGVND